MSLARTLKTSSLYRGVLLLGVFIGLLLSSSEGVRLLPFPPPDTSPTGLESIGKNVNGTQYFESDRDKGASKVRLDTSAMDCPGVAGSVFPSFGRISAWREIPSTETPVRIFIRDKRLPKGRAPPVFFTIERFL